MRDGILLHADEVQGSKSALEHASLVWAMGCGYARIMSALFSVYGDSKHIVSVSINLM